MNLAEHISYTDNVIKIKREIYPAVEVEDFLYTFSVEYDNYLSANRLPYIFEKIEDLFSYLSTQEDIVDLYNDWLDFIGNSDYECDSFSEALECCTVLEVVAVHSDSIDVKVYKLS